MSTFETDEHLQASMPCTIQSLGGEMLVADCVNMIGGLIDPYTKRAKQVCELPERMRVLQERGIDMGEPEMRILICFTIAVVMLVSPFVPLQTAAPARSPGAVTAPVLLLASSNCDNCIR